MHDRCGCAQVWLCSGVAVLRCVCSGVCVQVWLCSGVAVLRCVCTGVAVFRCVCARVCCDWVSLGIMNCNPNLVSLFFYSSFFS